jgi:hypothetical protein
MKQMKLILSLAILIAVNICQIKGHGRLLVPPARSSAWREDSRTFAPDYNDNQMFCGGFYTQYSLNSKIFSFKNQNLFIYTDLLFFFLKFKKREDVVFAERLLMK